MSADGPDSDAERLAALLEERDEIARELPVGFYTGWFDPSIPSFTFDYVSDRAAELLGVSIEQLRADWSSMLNNVHPEDVAALKAEVYSILPEPVRWTGRVLTAERQYWLDVFARESQTRPNWWVGVLSDVTERIELEHELERLASIDSLTGISNRRRFVELAEHEVKRRSRTGNDLSVLLIDVDHFKALNDALGHAAGDRALVAVASILSGSARRTDIVARLGGDEFALVLPDTDTTAACSLAARFAEDLRERRAEVPELASLSLSVGIATCSGPPGLDAEPSLDQLLQQADQAMYESKRAGRDAIRVFAELGG